MQRYSLFPSPPPEEWKNITFFSVKPWEFPEENLDSVSHSLCHKEASRWMDVDIPCCKWPPVVWHFYGYYSLYGHQARITNLQPGTQSHSVPTTPPPLIWRCLMAGNCLLHTSDIWGNCLKAVVANWTLAAMLSCSWSSCLDSLLS